MLQHPIVSRDAWLEARRALLDEEKALTRQQDALNAARQRLPWVRIERDYAFDSTGGTKTLAELFDGRSQLIAYYFMFGPDWDAGCTGCSFLADHIDGANQHLRHHDITLIALSRAPLAKLQAYRARMGWRFDWVSSAGSSFNHDFGVSFTKAERASGEKRYNFGTLAPEMDELPGTSVFAKDATGAVFHTYSTYARGDERSLGAYMFLDITPKGRNENGPHHNLMDWVKRHDEYAVTQPTGGCCA